MRILVLLLATWSVFGQSTFFNSNYTAGSGQAVTPAFSPPAGTYTSTQSVTISTTSAGCDAYIWWNLTGNPTGGGGDTNGTSVSVATSETVYAKVISCPGFTDSAVGSAAYTITASPSVVQSTYTTTCSSAGAASMNCNHSGGATTVNNYVRVIIHYVAGNAGDPTVSDDASPANSYTMDTSASSAQGAFTNRTLIYWGKQTHAATQVQVSGAGGANALSVQMEEWNSISTGTLDTASVYEATAGGTTSLSKNSGTTTATDLEVCTIYDRFDATDTITFTSSGWTAVAANFQDTTMGTTSRAAYKVISSGTTGTCAATVGTNNSYHISISALKQ